MALLFYFGLAVASWTLWNVLNLYQQYQKARSIGLPIVIAPVGNFNPLWIIFTRLAPDLIRRARHWAFLLGNWCRCTYIGWQFDDRGHIHRELGPAFTLCMPGYIEVLVADAAAAHHILTHRKDFIKPAQIYDGLNVFGRNVDSAEGEVWQRHRRITAPALNEHINGTVFAEAVCQATAMLGEWTQQGVRGTTKLSKDTATLAQHVWMRAGFGIEYAWKDETAVSDRMTYKDALFTVTNNFAILVIFPMKWLTSRFMPASIQRVGRATVEFKRHMRDLLEGERDRVAQSDDASSNLLRILVRANEEAWGQGDGTKSGVGLDDSEIYGNIFVYSFAGFETTANVLATTIAYLAAYPKWQLWLAEEIDIVVGKDSDSSDWSYEEVFPRMKRVLATMYETLRTNGSVVYIPKSTDPQPQVLNIAGKSHMIPADTFTTVNSHSIHFDPELWGPDPAVWRPDRWISKSSNGHEDLIQPPTGAFLAWADGQRICPGKKFAQVEFVAAFTTLFQKHGVMPVPKKGQSVEKAQKEVVGMIDDSGITAITVQMRNPEAVAMAWEAR